VRGYAFAKDASIPNQLQVILNVTFSGITIQNRGTYHVWDTDYTTYSLVYSCTPAINPNKASGAVEYAWILSRSKALGQTVVDYVKSKLTDKNVDISYFKATPQDC
jgi:lipocalin